MRYLILVIIFVGNPPRGTNYEWPGSKFGVTRAPRYPVLPIEQPSNYALLGMIDGCIRATQYSNV